MLLDQPTRNVYEPITEAETKPAVETGIFEDNSALALVVQDAIRAENFENQKQWVLGWTMASILYQSPVSPKYWEGTQIERANIPFYTVATAVNSLVPQVVNGLFSEDPPFMIQERPGTKAQAARAIGAILAYQMQDIGSLVGTQHNTFREEMRLGVMNAFLFGSSIWKYGWESYTHDRAMYRRKNPPITLPNPMASIGGQPIQLEDEDEEIEQEIITENVDRPSFEHIVNLRHVLVDPGLNVPDIRAAKYVIHRQYMTFEQLDKLREREGFTIPSKEKLLALFFPPREPIQAAPGEVSIKSPMYDARAEVRYEPTTANPLQNQLEVLERWDKKRCIMVLQQKLVICNDENPYGEIPFLSVNYWDVPEAFWGLGLAKTIGPHQRLQAGVVNTFLDNASLALNGFFTRVRGKSPLTQSIRVSPGKVVEVDNKDDFSPVKRLDPVPEALQLVAWSAAAAESVSGANDPTSQGQAGASGHSNFARSSAGAQILAAGAGNRVSDFVEKLANQVMLPFLYSAHEMNRALLPAKTMRHILSKELQHEYMNDERDGEKGEVVHKGGDMVELLNAQVKFSILAAAKLQAKRSMAQVLPVLVQFISSPAFAEQLALQGKKIDFEEVIRMFFAVSDWKNEQDVVIDMTPEDKQRLQEKQQGAQMGKLQGQMALEQQKFQNHEKLLDQENFGRAGRDIIRHSIEQAGNPMAATGAPGGGFEAGV